MTIIKDTKNLSRDIKPTWLNVSISLCFKLCALAINDFRLKPCNSFKIMLGIFRNSEDFAEVKTRKVKLLKKNKNYDEQH